MIVRYSSLNRFEKPKFILCNPGSVYLNGMVTNVVGILTDTEAEEIVFNFNATSELNLRVNRILRSSHEDNNHTLSLYQAVQNRRLIYVKDIGYFMITNVEDGFDGYIHYKDITAQSIDIEIAQKMVPFIENGTYRFIRDGSNVESEKGILDAIVEVLPLWTIGSVDPDVASKFRTFEDVSTSTNCLSFLLQNVQDAYECIIIFDNVNRVVNVYSQDNYVRQTDIHITKEDWIKSLDVTENADDLYTAISVSGGDNITIAPINPIGTNTIYDFSYYLDWMSEPLREKVVEWQEAVSKAKQAYYDVNLTYYTEMNRVSSFAFDIDRIDTQITMYKRCRDNIVADPASSAATASRYNDAISQNGGESVPIDGEISEILAKIDELIAECERQKAELTSQLSESNTKIDVYKSEIKEVHDRLSLSSYFTVEEYAELSHYIFEGSYQDDYVVVTDIMTKEEQFEQIKVLYDRAYAQLSRISQPTREFNVDVENFVFIKEFSNWSEQLETGCLINVELDPNDLAMLFLCTITINYDDHKLSMTFGNRFNKFDAKSLFNDVLGKISKSANTLSYIKDILYPIKNGEFNSMKEALQTSRNLTMGQALASTNEEVVIDGSGYTGRRLLDSGAYDPRQVKLTGKNLVFTDDSWLSCKVAIGELQYGNGESTYGINAETIIGDMIPA